MESSISILKLIIATNKLPALTELVTFIYFIYNNNLNHKTLSV